MVKIVLDAGHGLSTPGKRTPDGEREWNFNNKVVLAAINKLRKYENVEILRVDDPTGKTDISLNTRTNKANAFNADVYIACHHNANTGTWGPWTGVETYTYDHSLAKSEKIAEVIHPLVVKAVGLQDRGLKKQNFHVLRETSMPAILIEGGFMDSYIDINVLRDNAKLKAHGEAIAAGLVRYFGLKLKVIGTEKDYLSRGDTGKDVKQLQENLIKVGYKLVADSNFGPLTENAVKAFQTSNGLLVDGFYGPATKAKLENVVKPKPAPPKGTIYSVQVGVFSNKENAERLAKELMSIGYPVFIIES